MSLFLWHTGLAQQRTIRGMVTNAEDGSVMSGVTLSLLMSRYTGHTDHNGSFEFQIFQADSMFLKFIGFKSKSIYLPFQDSVLTIALQKDTWSLEDVIINTGYYQIPAERATGSFIHLSNKDINRAVGLNIINRLEGMVEGLQFVRPEGRNPTDLRIRGLSTIESDETPLIILDNFPYEGAIESIDPNTIESVTILKDASAASIWGARAGNGVIVITSIKPKLNRRTAVSIQTDLNFTQKPDFTYSKDWLPSEIVMGIEKKRFEEGLYVFNDRQAVSLYVDQLKRHQDGLISEEELINLEQKLRGADTRRSMSKHLYQTGVLQKTSLSVSGGGEWQSFLISASHTRDRGLSIGDKNQQSNLNLINTFYPSKKLMLSLGLNYLVGNAEQNSISYNQIHYNRPGTISPYLTFVDESGYPMAIPQSGISSLYTIGVEDEGLLDWQFRPVEERGLRTLASNSSGLILNTTLSYKLMKSLDVKALYQFSRDASQSRNHYLKESYYVRDLVNKFTQLDGVQIIPNNGILSLGGLNERKAHAGRLQLDFNRSFFKNHQLSFLTGSELRHSESHRMPGSILYNYDPEHLIGNNMYNYNQTYRQRPGGNNARIPSPSSSNRLLVNRDMSFYGNLGYSIDNKYVFSGSIRWDGSNLFGVKTNQKGVPLWSMGGVWNLNKEYFLNLSQLFNQLRLRVTYGIAGNVNKSLTHMPTVRYDYDPYTQLPSAALVSVGNPSLRWERVGTANVGLDWSLARANVGGSVEFYSKNGKDLIGSDFMDPTTGVAGEYKINYANIRTQGLDVRLQSNHKFWDLTWRGTLLSSWVHDKVTHYNTKENVGIGTYFSLNTPPMKGYSRDMLYSIPWNGISPDSGLPIIYINGELSSDYQKYYSNYLEFPMLIAEGSQIPTWYGSLRNELSFKGFELSIMFGWKAGHVFRRSSIRPGDEYSDKYHLDYLKRWEKSGDERVTGVPRFIHISELGNYKQMEFVYSNSSYLIEKGDHIRLQDLRIGYTLPHTLFGKKGLKSIQIYGYAKNLALLWSANKQGIDPDYVDALYVTPRTFYMGLKIEF